MSNWRFKKDVYGRLAPRTSRQDVLDQCNKRDCSKHPEEHETWRADCGAEERNGYDGADADQEKSLATRPCSRIRELAALARRPEKAKAETAINSQGNAERREDDDGE